MNNLDEELYSVINNLINKYSFSFKQRIAIESFFERVNTLFRNISYIKESFPAQLDFSSIEVNQYTTFSDNRILLRLYYTNPITVKGGIPKLGRDTIFPGMIASIHKDFKEAVRKTVEHPLTKRSGVDIKIKHSLNKSITTIYFDNIPIDFICTLTDTAGDDYILTDKGTIELMPYSIIQSLLNSFNQKYSNFYDVIKVMKFLCLSDNVAISDSILCNVLYKVCYNIYSRDWNDMKFINKFKLLIEGIRSCYDNPLYDLLDGSDLSIEIRKNITQIESCIGIYDDWDDNKLLSELKNFL